MFCKTMKSTGYYAVFLAIGIVSLTFGLWGDRSGIASTGGEEMLLGMFSGMGSAMTVLSAIALLRRKFMSREKLKQKEIDAKDERNIQLIQAAYTVSEKIALFVLAFMAFLFAWLGDETASFISAGAIWVLAIVFAVSQRCMPEKCNACLFRPADAGFFLCSDAFRPADSASCGVKSAACRKSVANCMRLCYSSCGTKSCLPQSGGVYRFCGSGLVKGVKTSEAFNRSVSGIRRRCHHDSMRQN